ncbi:putative mitochondrial protein, partial [Mucuna pruriens]
MIFLGYRQSQGDHTFFIKKFSNGNDKIEKLTLKEKLTTQFEMKELGKLKYFLGIEVVYYKQGIFISQRKYVLDLLKETGKLGCKTSWRLVGKLIYLSHTRPDIAYAVSVVSQFMHDPKKRHLQASLRKGLLLKKKKVQDPPPDIVCLWEEI